MEYFDYWDKIKSQRLDVTKMQQRPSMVFSAENVRRLKTDVERYKALKLKSETESKSLDESEAQELLMLEEKMKQNCVRLNWICLLWLMAYGLKIS